MSVARKAPGYLPLFEIARGGIGRVELCVRREGAFERLYALKRLHPHLRDDEEFRSMFLDEARITGLLRHANVISVVDVGEDFEGPFLVMDYIDGVSLRELMRTAGPANLPPIQVCVDIAAQVARGLHAAHELRSHEGEHLGLIHRDVSPQNVMVGYDGVVRVGDFGIAKALGQRSQTSTGILKGKTGYFSPEQLRFEEIDRRSDLFSLGIVLYELVSGRRLYGGTTGTDVFRRILHEPVPEIGTVRRNVPPMLEELLFDLLAKQPDDRPSDAQSVAERLSLLAQDLKNEEGTIPIEVFLAERFAAAREEKHGKVAAALEGVTISRSHRRDSAATRNVITVTSPSGRRSRKRPAAWVMLIAGAFLGGVLVGLPLLLFDRLEPRSGLATAADVAKRPSSKVTSASAPTPASADSESGFATAQLADTAEASTEPAAVPGTPASAGDPQPAKRVRRRPHRSRPRRPRPRRPAPSNAPPAEQRDLWWSVDRP